MGGEEKTKVRLSPLVDRIAGRGAGAWSIHMEAARLRDQGQDVIFLTVGFLTVGDLTVPRGEPVLDACEGLDRGIAYCLTSLTPSFCIAG
jgi:hypothetical protein